MKIITCRVCNTPMSWPNQQTQFGRAVRAGETVGGWAGAVACLDQQPREREPTERPPLPPPIGLWLGAVQVHERVAG